ncbi:hypothetical protein GGI03_007535, partial [Coemansia sp. RSA 2337]
MYIKHIIPVLTQCYVFAYLTQVFKLKPKCQYDKPDAVTTATTTPTSASEVTTTMTAIVQHEPVAETPC